LLDSLAGGIDDENDDAHRMVDQAKRQREDEDLGKIATALVIPDRIDEH